VSPALPSSALFSLTLVAAALPAHAQITAAAAATSDASAGAAVQSLPAITISARADAATEGTDAYAARSASTATKLNLSPRETPQSISVITQAVIEDFSLANVNDLLSLTTGVNVERVEPDRSYFSVRGFEVSNFQVDGIGLPFATGDQLGDLDTVLYDRVEIVRGANGLITATGNPSATVNFVRKRPTASLQATAALTLGSWNDRRVEADVSGALNSAGSVRGRLIVAGEEKDSWLDHYSMKKTVMGGVIEADVTDSTLLTAGISRQYNLPRGTMWGALPLAYSDGTPTNYDRSASTGTDWTYWANDDTQAFGEITQQLPGDWQAKATLTRRLISSDAELLYVYGSPDPTTGEGLFSYPSKYGHTERQWVGDLHATGPFSLAGRRHELMLGFSGGQSLNHLHSSDDDVGLALTESEMLAGSFPRPAFDQGLSGEGRFRNRQASLYAATRLNLADELKLFAGASLTRTTSTGEQYGEVHDFAKTKTTPYVGVVYDLAPSYSVYASYTGIFNPQTQLDQSGHTLDPIEGRNVELGAKAEWLGGKLTASGAVFKAKQDNTAEYAGFDTDTGRSYYRGVDASSTGFELEVAGQIAKGWELAAGYTQLTLEDAAGTDVRTYVPRRTLRLNTSYRLPMLPALKLGASVKWQSDISNGTSRQDAYALLDLMAGYEFNKNLSLTASLRNATDEKYLTSLLWAQSYYGAPRNVLVTLRWTY
jgi:outer membrane receptor for ferric coprogen and ferric-rhodotorulic acid